LFLEQLAGFGLALILRIFGSKLNMKPGAGKGAGIAESQKDLSMGNEGEIEAADLGFAHGPKAAAEAGKLQLLEERSLQRVKLGAGGAA